MALSVLAVIILSTGLAAAAPLAEADALYDKGGIENIKNSIGLYLKAVEADPNNFEAAWKCARAHRQYGKEAKENKVKGWKDICAEYGKKGMQYAEKAIAIDPKKANGHYYYGLSVGTYSDGVSILTALREGLKDKTQTGFEKAYEMDKLYNDAGPILSLARFWQVLPWPLNDKDKSLKYFKEFEATKFYATSAEGHIYYAELLIDLGGDANEAKAKEVLEYPLAKGNQYFKDWAKRLMKELE
jgi:hypothetical protein